VTRTKKSIAIFEQGIFERGGILVNTELSAQLKPSNHEPEIAAEFAPRQSTWLRSSGTVLAGSVLVAACAHVALPLYFTPVPLSLAPLAVLVLGLVLRPGLAAATLCAYLGEGALGLPVFSATPAAPIGMVHLLGPTGGYLLSYPLAAALVAFLVRGQRADGLQGFTRSALSAAAGSLVILACGALWLGVLTHVSIGSVLNLAVLPFLPGDVLKIVFAAALADGWVRIRHRTA
jgi:biotin transport system substrate-specific component